MYFNVNFNMFFKLIKVHLLVSELYILYIRMYGATIRKKCNKRFMYPLHYRALHWNLFLNVQILFNFRNEITFNNFTSHLQRAFFFTILKSVLKSLFFPQQSVNRSAQN